MSKQQSTNLHHISRLCIAWLRVSIFGVLRSLAQTLGGDSSISLFDVHACGCDCILSLDMLLLDGRLAFVHFGGLALLLKLFHQR